MKTTPFYIITATIMALATPLQAADVTVPNTFSAGTPAVASEVNDNFSELQTGVNDNDTRLTATEADITNIETTKQNRVAAAGCAEGSSIRVINSDGSVVCEVDTDTNTNTTYTNGFGINLSGTTFSIDNNETQQRVSASCAAGSSIRVINVNGTVACEADTDTTYSNGFGLNISGTTFNVDSAVMQRRVTGTCAAGSSIREIYSDGTVLCEIDTDTNSGGDITGVTAGAGLAGGGTSGAVTVKRAAGAVSINNRALNVSYSPTCDLSRGYSYSYFLNSSTSTCSAAAGVNLPDLATVTEITCRLLNNDITTIVNPLVILGRHNLSDGVFAEMSRIVSGGDSTTIQTLTDTTINYVLVNNSSYSYSLMFTPGGDADSAGENKRFYNCTIKYAY